MELTLLSLAEAQTLPAALRRQSGTDFALANGLWQNQGFWAANGKRTVNTWLRSAASDFRCDCLLNGTAYAYSPQETTLGVVPVLVVSEKIEQPTVQLGAYPQCKVDAALAAKLETLYNHGNLQGGLTCSGRLYTTSQFSPEFIYQGERYVRTRVQPHYPSYYQDGSPVPAAGTIQWLRVAPLTFRVAAVSAQRSRLVANEAIIAGIPFNPDNTAPDATVWEQSALRTFVQEVFGPQAFAPTPVREYAVPADDHQLAPYALAGCVGLEKIIFHPGVTQLGEHALADLSFRWAYQQSRDQALVLAQSLPAASEYTTAVDLVKLRRVINDFDYDALFSGVSLAAWKELGRQLGKAKLAVPVTFAQALLQQPNATTFLEHANFGYLRGELPQLCSVLATQPLAEQNSFWKFATELGCFSAQNLLDDDGVPTSAIMGQKASAALGSFLRGKHLQWGQFAPLFADLPLQLRNDQDFLQFINHREQQAYPNLHLLLVMEQRYPQIFAKTMSNFRQAQNFQKTYGVDGSRLKLPWWRTLQKFYFAAPVYDYDQVSEENLDIAQLFAAKGLEPEVFQRAAKLRHLALDRQVGHHLLAQPLRETANYATAAQQTAVTTAMTLNDTVADLEQLYAQQFTYEMLDKYDPHNFIMGLLCSCCASITSTQYGRKIAESTVLAPDVQNMVVRNYRGEIVAKGTFYLNREQGYGVFNDFEMNDKYRQHENAKETALRNQIFAAFQRGIAAFVEAYDRENPEKPLQVINVGAGYNRLRQQCEQFNYATENLTVPGNYFFVDADESQLVIYQRPEREQ